MNRGRRGSGNSMSLLDMYDPVQSIIPVIPYRTRTIRGIQKHGVARLMKHFWGII